MSDLLDRLNDNSERARSLSNKELAAELFEAINQCPITDDHAVILAEAAKRLVSTDLTLIDTNRNQ